MKSICALKCPVINGLWWHTIILTLTCNTGTGFLSYVVALCLNKSTQQCFFTMWQKHLFGSSVRNRHARRILWTSADICVMHDDLGWKNWTTLYNCRFSAASLALWVIFVRQKRPPIYASCMTISGGRTEQHVIGFEKLAAVDGLEYVDIRLVC